MVPLEKNKEGIYVSSITNVLSYPEEGNDLFFELEDKSFWFNHRNKIIEAAINRHPFKNNFADIGGGNGFQIDYLAKKNPGAKFYLIEPFYTGCRNARKRGIEEVYCMSFKEFPFRERKVDGIGLFDVVEHIEHDVTFLKELKECTSEGTVLYLTAPAFQNLWSDVDDFSGHYRRYTRESIASALSEGGWQILSTSYFFSFLPPLVWMMRCLPYKIRGSRKSDEITEAEKHHHNGAFFERLLFKLHQYEPAMISKKSIKFGGSVLAVAINHR
jgi:hypothetical protein